MKQEDGWKARPSFSSNSISQRQNFNWKGAGLDPATSIKKGDMGSIKRTVEQDSQASQKVANPRSLKDPQPHLIPLKTLLTLAGIDPVVTTRIWQALR